MTAFRAKYSVFWSRLSRLDVAALAVFAIGGGIFVLGGSGKGLSFVKFLAAIAWVYLLFRVIGWWRTRLLWSLRNRLIVAGLFIALVPILLIVTLVALAGRILYSQLGAYLLYEDMQTRINTIADMAEHIAAAHGPAVGGSSQEELESVLAGQS